MSKRAMAALVVFTGLFGIALVGGESTQESPFTHPAQTNLYNVQIRSHVDAKVLSQCGVDAVINSETGYLVLTDLNGARRLAESGLRYTLIATDINRHEMALYTLQGDENRDQYPPVYEDGRLRICRIDKDELKALGPGAGLIPVPVTGTEISYWEPEERINRLRPSDLEIGLDELIGLVSYDSIVSYSEALQQFGNRPSETGTNSACANWLYNKFVKFGYDSVAFDHFIEDGWWETGIEGKNVLAYKFGSLYVYDRIIVCAHFDGVQGSPAADDNGSGVAAVLEIARILKDLETDLTIVFALWDAEEDGLVGSHYYADRAFETDERIALVLNLDMIGFWENSSTAWVFHTESPDYAAIWAHMADSLQGIDIDGAISTSMSYNSAHSDHRAFVEVGYDGICIHERIFSEQYHQPNDSTVYLNFDYMTRMTMASLATIYYVGCNYIPPPALLFFCPEGLPELIAPGSEDTVRIHVEEYCGAVLAPGSVSLNCSLNNGPKFILPMTDLGEGDYEVPLPPLVCGDLLTYHVMAVETVEECIYRYPDPDNPANSIMASSKLVLLEDSFESDLGWTVSGDATSGHWIRYQALANSGPPDYDYDRSGRMYMTDYLVLKDVDNGSAILESPMIDVSHGKTTVEYARCFYNGTGITGETDVFRIYVNDAVGWVKVDSAGPKVDNEGKWAYNKFWLHEIRSPLDLLQLRFVASDEGLDSEVEAAVDAVKVVHYSVAPPIYTESVPSTLIGTEYNLQFEASGCYDPLTWSDKYGELEGTGLTFSPEGLLSGTPPDTGVISFTAHVEDATGVPNERYYSFRIWLPFVCGDAGMDYQLNVGDAVFIINYVFRGGPAPNPLCAGDANGDEDVNVGDAVYLINHIFKGGPVPIDGCCL